MNNTSRNHLLAQIASMYYLDKKSQEAIAQEFGYSRSAISRLLKEAEEKNIVEYKINFPSIRNNEFEEKIKQAYKLRDVIVVNRGKQSYAQTLRMVGEQGADLLKNLVMDDQIIAVSTGTSLYELINAFESSLKSSIRVVQLHGATGVISDPIVDGPELAGLLARKVMGRYFTMNAPMIVDHKSSRDTIIRQKTISNAMDMAYQSDIVLAGIGSVTEDPEDVSVVRSGSLELEEFQQAKELGAVGFICGWFFGKNGEILENRFNDRVIAADFQRIRTSRAIVVVIAIGEHKTPAIKAALKGNLFDILITDSSATEEIIKDLTEVEWQKRI